MNMEILVPNVTVYTFYSLRDAFFQWNKSEVSSVVSAV